MISIDEKIDIGTATIKLVAVFLIFDFKNNFMKYLIFLILNLI
ncbi:protein of unknown function [Oenococcus oeni]|nr:hypothetical protein OENI_240028 [Oenococcus oeni]SYW03751.1 hypothetical protein OENI_80056 [Oenococcus oeni]VDC14523.1 protein of unknown function [Oenococcus oeni]